MRERTLFGAVAELSGRAADWHEAMRWPTGGRYRDDPVRFAREVLGVEPWSRQIEILEAIRDNDRVAVSSGHKVGKSNTAGLAALWFYDSFDDARVVATCVTARQIDEILYREIKKLVAQSGHCVDCRRESEARVKRREAPLPKPCRHSVIISDVPGKLARTGLTGEGFRQFRGFTAREKEAVAGTSGARILYLVDEASGVPDEIYEAIAGNMAADGSKVALFSNPTQAEGEFFEAFHGKKARFYKALRVSSEETPNVIAGREIVPGLAGKRYIEEKRIEWGEDSPLYKIRIKGEHVLDASAKIISVHLIGAAEERWEDAPSIGRLHFGIDVAGESGDGDEIAIAVRRGTKLLELHTWQGLTDEGILVQLLGLLKQHREERELIPIACYDELGPIGVRFGRVVRAHLERHPEDFLAFGLRSSELGREPQQYWHIRDELWANLRDWLRRDGAIMSDDKLIKELNAPSWTIRLTGQAQATDKKELRKILGRSPDRADALALAVWEPSILDTPRPREASPRIDPYDRGNDEDEDPVYGGRKDQVYG